MAESAWRPGDVLPGTRYRVVRELGVGGMGVVYQVVKPPEIQGVLKLMNRELAGAPEFRILAQLEHPNIGRVFDYGALGDGTPFYAMELLVGRTLREALHSKGRLRPRVAFEITRKVLDALHAAHTHHVPVVHRDIKPENIFLHAPPHGEPTVKLIDFGVIAVGDTWRYAAPEQIRGERATPATDLYAVGLVLYEMLAGRGPFDHLETPDLLAQAHLRDVPPPVSDFAPWVPRSVVQLIGAALLKDARLRPRDARAFAERLEELEHASDAIAPLAETKPGPPLERVRERLRERLRERASRPAEAPEVPSCATPDEDALLAGLAARPDERVPSKKSRERGEPALIVTPSPRIVIRPSAPQLDSDTFASHRRRSRVLPLALGAFGALAMLAIIGILLVKLRAGRDAPTRVALPPRPPVKSAQ